MSTVSKWLRRAVLLAALAAAVVVGLEIANRHARFERDLSHYMNVAISDDRDEVMYKLGYPPAVTGPVEEENNQRWQRVYRTDGSDPRNALPEGASVEEYPEWSYDIGDFGSRIDVEFDGEEVQSITCFTNSQRGYSLDCLPLFGVSIGDSEETLIGLLGQPDRSMLSGVAKRVRYDDIGAEFVLTRSRVYMIVLHRQKGSRNSQIARFVTSLNPM
jgi:hypothetical protein